MDFEMVVRRSSVCFPRMKPKIIEKKYPKRRILTPSHSFFEMLNEFHMMSCSMNATVAIMQPEDNTSIVSHVAGLVGQ